VFFYTTRFEIDDIANLERSSATQRIPGAGRSEDRPVHGTQEKKHVPRCARDDSFILIFCFFCFDGLFSAGVEIRFDVGVCGWMGWG
jgi:hypothetical protein